MQMRVNSQITFAVTVFSICCSIAWSSLSLAVPQTINFQGTLSKKDGAGGAAVTDAALPMVFDLYDVEDGGKPLWRDFYSEGVSVVNGLYHVELGEGVTPLTTDILAADPFSSKYEF